MRSWRVRTAAAVLMTVAALPAAAQVFNPTTRTLDNGLQVVVVENHRAPIVSHMVWYRVGAADEPAGKSGIAHFLEHLMFKGTPAVPPAEFSKIVARNGGRDNAFTSSDYTAYFQNIAADRLELVMKMEADRMRNLTLAAGDVTSELEVVKEERRSRTDNDPAALLHERLEAALFVNHPYRRPIIGWPDELAGLTREDALAFYQRWYAPNNASWWWPATPTRPRWPPCRNLLRPAESRKPCLPARANLGRRHQPAARRRWVVDQGYSSAFGLVSVGGTDMGTFGSPPPRLMAMDKVQAAMRPRSPAGRPTVPRTRSAGPRPG